MEENTDSRSRNELEGLVCPYCGGKIRFKGWSNNGKKRRYLCNSCKKGFTGIENIVKKEHIVDMPCPYCGGVNIKRGGKLRSGNKRYFCKDCGKFFSEHTAEHNKKLEELRASKEVKPEKCPKCGGTHINYCGKDTKTKKQRYRCISCGYKFVKNPTPYKYIPWEKECPYCGHTKAKKAGHSGGKQYYKCLSCGHKYLEGGMFQHLNSQKKESIKSDLNSGMTKRDISQKYGVSFKTVYSITKGMELTWKRKQSEEKKQKLQEITPSIIDDIFKHGMSEASVKEKYNLGKVQLHRITSNLYNEETLNSEQQKMIFDYGICAMVPPEYLAPYVNCSLKKCREILYSNKLYPLVALRRKKTRTYRRSEEEKRQDYYALDRFLI